MKQLSTEKMVDHMLKFFLIFNLSFMFIDPLLGQIRNDQEKEISADSTSKVVLNDEVNYPGKPLIMSLILPGAGQFYNKSPFWKTASFLGVEIGSVLAWNYYQKEAEKKKDAYQEFADQSWTLNNWVTNRFTPPTHMHESQGWNNFEALTKLTGTHDMKLIISGDLANELNLTRVSSDSLDAHPEWFYSGDIVVVRDRHFYENIGKYDQFVGGWEDASTAWYWEEKDVGDSTEIVIKTPMKQDFIDQRFESNRMLSAAKYSITVLMFNHVLSGIESVWSNQKKANAIKNQQSSKLQTDFGLVYDPSAKLGVGGLKLSVYF